MGDWFIRDNSGRDLVVDNDGESYNRMPLIGGSRTRGTVGKDNAWIKGE